MINLFVDLYSNVFIINKLIKHWEKYINSIKKALSQFPVKEILHYSLGSYLLLIAFKLKTEAEILT